MQEDVLLSQVCALRSLHEYFKGELLTEKDSLSVFPYHLCLCLFQCSRMGLCFCHSRCLCFCLCSHSRCLCICNYSHSLCLCLCLWSHYCCLCLCICSHSRCLCLWLFSHSRCLRFCFSCCLWVCLCSHCLCICICISRTRSKGLCANSCWIQIVVHQAIDDAR